MYELAPAYLMELARQMAFLSAFLGGLAAVLLQLLLPTQGPRRLVTVAVGFTTAAAVAFIIALTGATMMTTVLHPEAPAYVADAGGLTRARAVSTLMFMLGLYCLLVSLGLCGWIRSRATGLTTSIAAVFGVVMVTWAATGF